MSHARASRLCWGLILISAQAARKAFINPLRHYNETSGQIGFVLDIEGSESVQEVLDAVQDFLANVEEYQETISKHRRRHSSGEFVCNEQLVDTQNIWSTMQMIVNAGFTLTRRYINVGAHDGHIDDPLYEYARSTNPSGVAVERQPGLCARHREALPNVKVVCSEATPQGILDMIRPVLSDASEIDVMKVDIDSFDCPVLETLLPEVRARIVLVEANPSVPPPYQWAMLYHPELWHFFANFSKPEEVPIRGCSLSYEVQLLRRFGYDLIAFGGHDAVFAHESVRSAFRAFTEVPMDEFDCYNKAFISANGISIDWTRRLYYKIRDVQAGLPEIWEFFASWMQANSPRLFPFALRDRKSVV